MHALIAKRGGSGGGHSRTSSTRSIPEETAQTPPPDNFTKSLKSLEELSAELDMTLTKGASNHERFVDDVQSLIDNNQAVSIFLCRMVQPGTNILAEIHANRKPHPGDPKPTSSAQCSEGFVR
jgi:hypothetical protein